MPATSDITQAQSTSLDDTDCYASVWEEILGKQRDEEISGTGLWGGRGKGGRGLARRTIQPRDIVVDKVRLQFLKGDVFLEGAKIKLLQDRVYCLVGKNGCGKSTLLQRMHAQKIPGWSVSWSSLYIPADLPNSLLAKTPLEIVLHYYEQTHRRSVVGTKSRIQELEDQLERLNVDDEQDKMESICDELSTLEDQLEADKSAIEQQARDALHEFGIYDVTAKSKDLSRGQRKRVLLSVAWICSFINLLLLDEPTDNLDVLGLIQLRRLIELSTATVLLVSHDMDLINDVATDIIDMSFNELSYYPGNYDSYRLMREQQEMHELRQSVTMEKKRAKMKNALQNLKEKPVPKRGGAKKKNKAVACQRRKLEKHESQQKNTNNASSSVLQRKGLTAAQRMKLAEIMKSIPDKEVQFVFPKTTCFWGEPPITVLDVGHSFDLNSANPAKELPVEEDHADDDDGFKIVKKDGFLFDCVELCIEEGSKTCILGPTASGKSSLLKILAKKLNPVEGSVRHASGIRIGYFDPDAVDDIVFSVSSSTTALDYLQEKYPQKTEQDLRGHLTAFGLAPTTQAKTPICCMSGGEKCRFALSSIMLDVPPVLFLDNPTTNLDVESVRALIYGLRQWNGTLVLASQDFYFLRSLENVKCAVITPEEGKLRRIEGGIDSYLKCFKI